MLGSRIGELILSSVELLIAKVCALALGASRDLVAITRES